MRPGDLTMTLFTDISTEVHQCGHTKNSAPDTDTLATERLCFDAGNLISLPSSPHHPHGPLCRAWAHACGCSCACCVWDDINEGRDCCYWAVPYVAVMLNRNGLSFVLILWSFRPCIAGDLRQHGFIHRCKHVGFWSCCNCITDCPPGWFNTM